MLNPHSDAAADGQVPSQVPAGLSLSEEGPSAPGPPDAGLGTGGGPRAPRHVTQAPPAYSACLSAPSDRCWVLFACGAKPREWGRERTLLLGGKHEVASQKEHAQGHCSSHRFIVLDQSLLVSTAPSLHSLALPQPTLPRRSRWNASSFAGTSLRLPYLSSKKRRALAPSCAAKQNHFLPGVTLVLLVTSCPTSKHPRAGAWSRRCPLKHGSWAESS